jgi:hypothetical protein
MKKLLIIAAAALALTGCFSDPNEATRVLTEAGYTQIQITGYQYTGCGKEDNIHTGFVALGPTHHKVSGVVCSDIGPFGKSNTIRIN